MTTLYPGSIDGYSQIRVARDGIDEIIAGDHNDLRSAVVSIEQTLGITPQGAFGTVASRLDDSYSNLTSHVLGGVPLHPDTSITSPLRAGSPFTLNVGSVGSQLDSLLVDLNSISSFTGLSDTPPSLFGNALNVVRVNSLANALEFFTQTFTLLSDTPSSYSSQAGKSIRVNTGETGFEFFLPTAVTFTNLTDTPTVYTGDSKRLVRVNVGETGLEFVDGTAVDGILLQDGTRAMTAALAMGGFDINYVGYITNSTGVPLNLVSDADLTFQDQFLAASVALSQVGVTDIYQPTAGQNPSIVGALSSQARISEALTFNRSVDKTGSFSPSAGTTVTYPALNLLMNGEYVTIASAIATATTGAGTYYIMVRSDTLAVVITETTSSEPASSVIVWKGDFDGGTTWSNTFDLRWPSTRKGDTVSIYVGDQAGADFADIDDAFTFAQQAAGASRQELTMEIVVVGTATADSTLNLPNGWTLRGLNFQGFANSLYPSLLKTTTTFATTSDVVSAGWNCTIKNIRLAWENTSANQDTANYAIDTLYNARIENVRIEGNSFEFGNCVRVTSLPTSAGSLICHCQFIDQIGYAVVLSGVARTTINACSFFLTTSSTGAIDMSSTGFQDDDTAQLNVVRDCKFRNSPSTRYIYAGGPNILIENCEGDLTGSAAQTAPFVEMMSGHASQDRGGVTIRNNFLYNGYSVIQSTLNNANLRLHIIAEGNYITNFSYRVFNINNTAVESSSSITIRDNHIGITSSYVGYFNNAYSVFFRGNKSESSITGGLYILGTTFAVVEGNHFEGWSAANNLIEFASSGGSGSRVVNNYLATTGAPATGAIIKVTADNVNISNNHLDTSAVVVDYGIHVQDCDDCVISGNHIGTCDVYSIWLDNAADTIATGGHSVSGNVIRGTSALGIHVYVFGFQNVKIDNNHFGLSTTFQASGSAIVVKDNVAGKADRCSVLGNDFMYVKGDGAEDSPNSNIVYFVAVEGGRISDNSFVGCGDDTASNILGFIIRVGLGETVVNNKFKDIFGSQNASASTWIISGGGTVEGNQIDQNMDPTSHVSGPAGTNFYGISVGSAVCSGNFVNFSGGNAAGGPTNIYGIIGSSGSPSITGNVVGSWNLASATIQKAISTVGLSGVVVVGNLARRHNIDTGAAEAGGMVIGNVALFSGDSVLPAAHAIAGNVSTP